MTDTPDTTIYGLALHEGMLVKGVWEHWNRVSDHGVNSLKINELIS